MGALVACGLVLAACGGGGAGTAETTEPDPVTPSDQGSDPVALPATVRVGAVGCSVTLNAVAGTHFLGSDLMWPHTSLNYGGGSINVWALELSSLSTYWGSFDLALAANPDTDAIWFQLCSDLAGASQDTFENAQVVINEILNRAPGVRVFVSAQHAYSDGVCNITGPDGPTRMQALAEQLVAAGFAEAGPVVGPLSMSQTLDGCHANEEGALILGAQLLEFFN